MIQRTLAVLVLLNEITYTDAIKLRSIQPEPVAPVANGFEDVEESNPAWISTMTISEWNLYSADETLDMYQKADYLVNKLIDEKEQIEGYVREAVDDLELAVELLDETNNQVQKLDKRRERIEERAESWDQQK